MRRSLPVALVAAVLLALLSRPSGDRFGAASAQEPATPALAASPAAADCPTTSEAENEAVARRWFEDILNGPNLGALDDLLAPDVAYAGVTFPDTAADHAAARRILDALLTGFPDIRYTVDAAVAEGNLVALRWTATGTHGGEFLGYAPTNRRATWSGINIFQLACGRIAAVWPQADGVGRFEQLGLQPIGGGISAVTVGAEIGLDATPDAEGTPAGATPLAEECAETGPVENEILARRWWGEAWNRGNVAVFDEILAEDHLHHWAVGPDTTGTDAIADRILGWRQTFPDLRIRVEEVVAADVLVAARWTATGTLQAPFMGVAPDGQRVEWTGINIFRVECGRIADVWSQRDTLGLYAQRGAAAAPAATPAAE